ncbi:substrate-binding periplasmic protein [Saccharospirillum salsuginis]|uniref:Solute-binding protein family 3/N-terminal domain-containing protein n=1 Tax=Saccharospirillum salsuginis TaxID=418750 RepID=A0A918K1Q9_9GAMM|nr:transporter substrate-binding domain-containing protein [Saccharospirillum salsuginis]GGX43456.1 hypothetical protein GCM10007392_07740 [Saccharospirillum salsuginis]
MLTLKWLLVTGLALGSMGVAAYAEDSAPLPLVTGYDYAPFSDDDLPHGGLATLVVTAVFDLLEEPIEVDFLHWTRGYEAAREGQYAGTFPYIHSLERAEHFLYSEPLFEVGSYLYVHRNTQITAREPKDLTGLTLCLPVGYAPGPLIGQMVEEGRIDRVSPINMGNCFKRLLEGEVSFVKINRYVARDILRNAGVSLSEVRALPFKVENLTMHFIVPKSRPDAEALVERFDRALGQLRDSGRFEEIVDAYFDELYSVPEPEEPS